ncbi:hypothetical protein HX109_14595 [Galbibacter sp. BG1]|uniref:hypothetical protein n=1 Tax=Galbibacter sp. BG1 TaxID=1170699 RepID=UPI0015C10162|nr:hypothetical protein [Galbibacter sp. BG1]QLE02729.1 hypothetical protein HX109_14595 [Galbibacter sp. BG1]
MFNLNFIIKKTILSLGLFLAGSVGLYAGSSAKMEIFTDCHAFACQMADTYDQASGGASAEELEVVYDMNYQNCTQ